MGCKLDMSYYDYDRIRTLKPMVEFKDIEMGVVYHIPPTILYERRDFIPEQRNNNASISGKVRNKDGTWGKMTLYSSEISARFMVKKQKINNH
jgi:hypothetical protein